MIIEEGIIESFFVIGDDISTGRDRKLIKNGKLKIGSISPRWNECSDNLRKDEAKIGGYLVFQNGDDSISFCNLLNLRTRSLLGKVILWSRYLLHK